ncbi:MAG: T9SS type A sorting domain-containing protein, partial [Bacteroidales bacterium]|nr:T9SS type A sorting domain-containing protein [Bacteroidales bacterium]
SADYELVSLMPMDTAAFNPMSMYFEPNEGSPIVYAKNKIHFRFWNNLDFFSDTVKTYVDMMVSRNVLADTIERNTTEMIASPSGSNIHWFVLDAGIGDSLAFKADKGCALQLFAPSGEREMFSSGLTSIEWNTLTAKEAGFYHLAVSNASANNPNLNVSYFHLGKFDVVDYDVDRVGNGGYTNINYVGNGFDSLNTVMYINALNDTVTHVQIGHETNNHTSVLFNFSGADTGVYRAVFLFNDYVLTIDSALTIETARDIILTSNVSFPESYLRNSTVTYTLNITNTGNMTAYNIPFYAYIGSPNDSSISYIKFDGLDLPNIFESILDSIPENEREEWLRYGEEEIGDKHYFLPVRGIDEETGDTVSVLSGYFFVTVAPYETKTLSLNITSNGIVDVWFTIPDTIAVQSTAPQMQYSDSIPPTMLVVNQSFGQQYCCWKDRISCVFDIVNIGLDVADFVTLGVDARIALANCITSSLSEIHNSISDSYCVGEETPPNAWELWQSFSGKQSIVSTIYSCAKNFGFAKNFLEAHSLINKISEAVDNYFTVYNFGAGQAETVVGCIIAFTEKKPNCPPKDPKGGKSNPVNSFDPNEIYGYIAESGSLAVGSEVEELFYTIQFENDTVFASSNASNVYLIDSLDSDLFDLSSFGARKVIIGSKEITLNGEKEFIRTMDMRPDINCLAQISLTFDSVNGVANWVFSTLDPISLEEINIPNRGFLPVNYYGEGIGEVMFTINRKNNLVDSTLIPNYATIIFDNNEGINTSIWQNVVDVTPPQSSVSNITITDTMALLTVQATDNISGVWKYDVFAQYGANAEWEKVGENIPIDSMISVRVYDGMNTGFVSIAIDSAGNVENKPLLRDNDIFALHVFSETNETQGYVNGLGSYDSLSVVELTAVANVCYQFVSWNDGNTDNPRSFTLTKDTTFTALFEEIEFNTPISATICQGQVYTENGFNVSEAGVYTQTLTSVNGCDSIVTLTLNVNPIYNTELTATICEGSVYTENNFNVSEAGVYTQNLTSVNGCDSIVTLTVSVNPTFDTTINATINTGETYAEFGFNESESGTYFQNLQTVNGCDSTITLNLTVNSSLYDVAELAEITFYPNPTSGKVTFSKEIEKIEVIDNIGKIVMRFFDTNEINIETLPSGAYYLRMTIGDKTIMRKVIKE